MKGHYQILKLGAAALLGVNLVSAPGLITSTQERLTFPLTCFAIAIPLLGFVLVTIYFAEIEANRSFDAATERLRRFDGILSFATVLGASLTTLGLLTLFYTHSQAPGFAFFVTCAICVFLWIYIHRK